jgi:cytidylate kinase
MPVITISQQFGSYGDAVTELVCDRLGYRSLDRGLMWSLAAQAGLKLEKVMTLSEDRYRPRTMMERFSRHLPPYTRHPVMWAEYGAAIGRELLAAKSVFHLIQAAYEKGNIVIVGRGGHVVLRDKPDALHVRLIAPLALRIRRRQLRGLTIEAAHAQVVAYDRAAAEFIQRYHGVDIADPTLYDLVINTGTLPLPAAADLIIGALTGLPTRA